MIIHRRGRLIYYTYLRYGLLTGTGKEGALLGISMVFNGICSLDAKGIFELFDKLYHRMSSRGEILK